MVGGWWNDPLFAELNRSTSPYPYPTATPFTPSPRPRLAPHLRHALLLARVSLPSVHAVPSPVRAPPPFPLATSLLPRGAHRPPAAQPTAAAPQDTGHTAARAAGSRAGQIDLVPDWLLLARQAYVRARPQQPAAASTVSLPRTASRTRTPTLTQTPNPHTSPYPNQERHHAPYSDRAPEPVCARGLANRRPDVVSIVSRVDSQCVFCPRGHRPEGACRYWYTPERHPWGVWAGWLVRRVVHVSIDTVEYKKRTSTVGLRTYLKRCA